MKKILCALLLGALVSLAMACGDSGPISSPDDAQDAAPVDAPVEVADASGPDDVGPPLDVTADAPPHDDGAAAPDEGEVVLPAEPLCDGLQGRACVLPWPSSLYLEPDGDRVTGYTLRFGPSSLPANALGVHVGPDQFARMDGYSVGTSILLHMPNVDLTGLATEWDLAPSLAPPHPTVILKVADDGTVTRVPHWAEVDGRAKDDPHDQLMFLRPAVILEPATRYVVAVGALQDADGVPFDRPALMQAYLDGDGDGRQARMDEVFGLLAQDGVDTASLTLAWDFVTASSEATHGTAIEMRDKALEAVGPDGPALTLTEVVEYSEAEHADIWLEIRGEFESANFLKEVPAGPSTAWLLNKGEDGALVQNGWRTESVWIRVPHSAKGGNPQSLVNYGHGQNGSGSQVKSGHNAKPMNDHGLIYYGCDMLGMSDPDVLTIMTLISDFTGFQWMADRLHQGLVNHVQLHLAMAQRFPLLEEISGRGVVVNPSEHFYSGISQGGIYGPSVVALSPFIQRGHLGVPGTNYARLLSRSKNFEEFYMVIDAAYPSHMDQALGIEMIHTIWSQTDSVTWYRRLAVEPVPDSGVNHVLLAPARGDHQVAVVTTETLARSGLDVAVMAHYDDEREVPLVAETPYPHTGSGIVLYAFGNPWPPPSTEPPTVFAGAGDDPHGKPRKLDHHTEQMVTFWRTGEIIDVCGGDGCTPD